MKKVFMGMFVIGMLALFSKFVFAANPRTGDEVLLSIYNSATHSINADIATSIGNETIVNLSSTTVYTINANANRLAIIIQTRTSNTGNIYLRLGSNLNVATQGIELVAGQSYSLDNYTGAIYLLTEAGKSEQKFVWQEITK